MKRIALLFLTAAIASSAAVRSKISSDLTAPSSTYVQVIIQWMPYAGSATGQKVVGLGGTILSEFNSVHSGVYSLPSTSLSTLKADPDVKFISLDRKLVKKTAGVSITAGTVNAQAAWKAGYTGIGIGVAVLDSGINADDDLGTVLHAPVYTEDFTVSKSVAPNGGPSPLPPSYGLDWFAHGQHVAGIIASNGKSSNCSDCTFAFAGIAPGVKLINLKVLDSNGEGSDSSVIAAIDRAISLQSTYNIRVINLSVGRAVSESYTVDPLCQAVEAAWKSGIVVVVAAGNDGRDNSFGNQGYSTITSPGNDPYVITVGAMKSMGTIDRSDDLIASYSSKGPTAVDHFVKPDLVAPGNLIASILAQHSTLPLNYPQNLTLLSAYKVKAPALGNIKPQPTYNADSNTQPPNVAVAPGYSNVYLTLSGTSMAAAVVSGAAADLLQASPGLTPDQVKMILMATATKTFPSQSSVTDASTGQTYTSYYDIFTVGAGYLDLKAALAAVGTAPTGLSALSPTASFDSDSSSVTLVFDPTSVFSDKCLWGTESVASSKSMWGASAIWSSSVLVGTKCLWGTSSVTSDKCLWGTNAIWSDKCLWGTSTTSAEASLVDGEQ